VPGLERELGTVLEGGKKVCMRKEEVWCGAEERFLAALGMTGHVCCGRRGGERKDEHKRDSPLRLPAAGGLGMTGRAVVVPG
jgi:hypothetical protein